MQFIEYFIGVSPDGASGVLELWLLCLSGVMFALATPAFQPSASPASIQRIIQPAKLKQTPSIVDHNPSLRRTFSRTKRFVTRITAALM